MNYTLSLIQSIDLKANNKKLFEIININLINILQAKGKKLKGNRDALLL